MTKPSATTSVQVCGQAEIRKHRWRLCFLASGLFAGWLGLSVGAGEPTPAAAVSEPPPTTKDRSATQTNEGSHSTTAKESDEQQADSQSSLGPALVVPREVLAMLDQRRRYLDRREASLRGAEERLLSLKTELEQIVSKYEKLAAIQQRKGDEAKKGDDERKARRDKEAADSRNQQQGQLAKIYESMPAEEAAARLERMPERKAIEVLRILKPKSAGAILAAVRPERAARLTEQLLAAR